MAGLGVKIEVSEIFDKVKNLAGLIRLFMYFKDSTNMVISKIDGLPKYSLTKRSHSIITEIIEHINNL